MTTVIKRERRAAMIYGSLGVVNLTLNLILVPRLGIIGSAFATVITDAVGAAQFYLLFRREFGTGLDLKRLIRVPAAAGLMGLLVFAVNGWNLVLLIAAGAAVYLLATWLMGTFSKDEIANLYEIWRQRKPQNRMTTT